MDINRYIRKIKKEKRLGAYASNLLDFSKPIELKYSGVYKGYVYFELKHVKTGSLYLDKLELFCDHHKLSKFDSNLSYIILKKSYKNTVNFVQYIDKMLTSNSTLKIGLDGYASAGKTSLAYSLSLLFDILVIHTDDFFKKPNLDMNNILSQYGSNIDFKRMNETIIEPYSRRQAITYKPFDFKTHQHGSPITKSYKPILLIEGAYAMHPYLNIAYDLRVFYKIGYIKQLLRLRRRGLKRLVMFIKRWIPNERAYNKALKIEQQAELVLYA